MSRRRALVHARWEFRLLIRNGEQLLLMFIIPIALLIALTLTGRAPVQTLVPAVLAVSILATCFTSLAIGTGFERRSGALRYAATTPLTRLDLVMGKLMATGALCLISLSAVAVTGALLGWRPGGWVVLAVPVAALGAAAGAAWAVLLAGTVRAEAVLAVANGAFLLLAVFGGVLIPTASMPGAVAVVIGLLPTAALANGLAQTLDGSGAPVLPLVLLAIWTLTGLALARRFFRWD